MKRFLSLLTISGIAVLGSTLPALTSSGGSPTGRTGSPSSNSQTCASAGCHSGPSVTSQTIDITTDIPATGFVANTDYTITVTANTNGGTGNRIGFSASVEDASGAFQGTIAAADSRSQKLGNYITHRGSSITPSGGSNSWDIDWNSGNAVDGTTVYVAVNFANGNGATSGDEIATETLVLNKSTISVNEQFASDLRVYNAADRMTIVEFSSSHLGEVDWSVMDMNGRVVAAGIHDNTNSNGRMEISNTDWMGGMYILHLKAGNKVSTEKFLVL